MIKAIKSTEDFLSLIQELIKRCNVNIVNGEIFYDIFPSKYFWDK